MFCKTILSISVLFFFNITFAQAPSSDTVGGAYIFNENQTPCLTDSQRDAVKQNLDVSVNLLRQQNRLVETNLQRNEQPLFIWPIQKAPGVAFNDVWAISGYVDHNANFPDQLTDFNCGTITYDTNAGYNHQGLDVYTWPYTWKLMDEDAVEIIAAADGQIIGKNDGQFDRSCNFNNNQWNAVYVQHGDGSVAWYGHMKNGSLTTKSVGDMVTAGEYLGVVGSSGNSTGPHLHLEVYTDNTYNQLVDPYAGSCNGLNTDSWWANQKPYTNTNINALMTHSQAPDVFPTCPTTETSNESSQFELGDNVFFSVYLRDQVASTDLNLKIRRPNGTYLFNWMYTATTTSSSWYYYWNAYPDVEGTWEWEVTYEGQTETYPFEVSEALNVEENVFETISVFPNPATDSVQIKSNSALSSVFLTDISGKQVISETYFSEENNRLNLQNLANGMYFLTVETKQNKRQIFKLIKK